MEPGKRTEPTRITVRSRSGSIVVRASASSPVEATGARVQRDGDGAFVVEGNADRVRVECPEGSDLILGTASGRVELEGRFGDVRITGSSGSVHVEHARTLDVRVRSGGVEIGTCDEACHVVVVSGRIRIDRAGPVDATGVSGSITAGAIAGGRLHTTSGRVRVGLDRAADLEVRAISSTVEIDVPRDVRPDVRASTVSGRVRSDVVHGDDCVISVHTVSGGIKVRWT